ncbi:MAG: efflux RND transporter periplasmic adaptor subunit, partial [Burkholderiales bacterium]|nr:efflux RND transporter periplasmic adaptor subunit [Burkholderiales bacterium]
APIVAPSAGIVIEAGALSGQRVEAATALFRIASAATLWLELQAPADRVGAIALGDRVEWPQRGVIARVSAIGAAVTTGQTATVRATVVQGAERIRPGESLQALVRLAVPAGANWRVPQTALAQLGERSVVFVAHPQGVRMVAVQVRGRDEDGAMIEAALGSTDRVVVSGVAALKSMVSEQRR